jgi:hypothetical protein
MRAGRLDGQDSTEVDALALGRYVLRETLALAHKQVVTPYLRIPILHGVMEFIPVSAPVQEVQMREKC